MDIKQGDQKLKIKASVPPATKARSDMTDLKTLNVRKWVDDLRERAVKFRRSLRS